MDENYIFSSSAAESMGIVLVKITREMVCAFIEFESWSSADRAWKKYMSTSWRTLLETGRTQILFYDVRSEKFCLINNDIDIPAGLADHTNSLTLLNYEGKLGIIQLREREEVVSWVLVDAASHKWSKHIYVLNPLGESIVTGNKFVGMTSTCFGLNQNHLWSLNLSIVINLSHHSSSKASCLSTFRRRPSVQRVHLAQSCDVVLKLPLFVHPSQVSRVFISSDFVTGAIRFQGPSYLFVNVKSRIFILFGSVEIHIVSSWSLDVGARAVHARSTSFQTLPFGLINVGSDYFMLMSKPALCHPSIRDSLQSKAAICHASIM
ncbi:hypothetical protein F2Q68_00019699 [Brassica cretica]|uniref:F-box associated beta-propeller type 3 domain-containing protein n=1 Tax=Brassica cretica TaxID=69181 RepID=A0A8S9FQY9_BRACR|nr:hypothetical protein F2Q68_00019699 [Brassica cretica]